MKRFTCTRRTVTSLLSALMIAVFALSFVTAANPVGAQTADPGKAPAENASEADVLSYYQRWLPYAIKKNEDEIARLKTDCPNVPSCAYKIKRLELRIKKYQRAISYLKNDKAYSVTERFWIVTRIIRLKLGDQTAEQLDAKIDDSAGYGVNDAEKKRDRREAWTDNPSLVNKPDAMREGLGGEIGYEREFTTYEIAAYLQELDLYGGCDDPSCIATVKQLNKDLQVLLEESRILNNAGYTDVQRHYILQRLKDIDTQHVEDGKLSDTIDAAVRQGLEDAKQPSSTGSPATPKDPTPAAQPPRMTSSGSSTTVNTRTGRVTISDR